MEKTFAFTVVTSALFEVSARSEEEAHEIIQDRLDNLSAKEFANEFEDNVSIEASELVEEHDSSREYAL